MDDATRGRLLVAAQFGALAGWLVLGPRLSPWPAGVAVQLLGVGLGAWAAVWMTVRQRRAFSVTPLPDAHPRLVTDGPYRWIRHPMYTALLAIVLPGALAGGLPSVAAGVWLVGVLWIKHRFEDGLLAARFGAEHAAWRRRTGGLLPFLG
ncbi:MAG: isoprenylcysteine carboxylmethyltransferase family protein [Burkholderiales bacterium]|nr:MAG: isoprenylcysteine carboxylmethyltransferase family protein [Burkholderiales bacterium]